MLLNGFAIYQGTLPRQAGSSDFAGGFNGSELGTCAQVVVERWSPLGCGWSGLPPLVLYGTTLRATADVYVDLARKHMVDDLVMNSSPAIAATILFSYPPSAFLYRVAGKANREGVLQNEQLILLPQHCMPRAFEMVVLAPWPLRRRSLLFAPRMASNASFWRTTEGAYPNIGLRDWSLLKPWPWANPCSFLSMTLSGRRVLTRACRALARRSKSLDASSTQARGSVIDPP